MRRHLVHKLGGAALADGRRIRRAATLLRPYRPRAVVTSAMAGTTDLLVADRPREVASRYRRAACDAGVDPAVLDDLIAGLARAHAVHDGSPRSRDAVLAFGERLSARLFATVFGGAVDGDAGALGLITDASFGEARAELGALPGLGHRIASVPGVAVVTGFTGATTDGRTTTLGRNSGDLSAALVAAAIGAPEAVLWGVVDGVMTADPRRDPGARVIAAMDYEDAFGVAAAGARVLHPEAVRVAARFGVELTVRNVDASDRAGTRIFNLTAAGPGRPTGTSA